MSWIPPLPDAYWRSSAVRGVTQHPSTLQEFPLTLAAWAIYRLPQVSDISTDHDQGSNVCGLLCRPKSVIPDACRPMPLPCSVRCQFAFSQNSNMFQHLSSPMPMLTSHHPQNFSYQEKKGQGHFDTKSLTQASQHGVTGTLSKKQTRK